MYRPASLCYVAGCTHTGQLIGDPGTNLVLSRTVGSDTHQLLAESSVTAERLELGNIAVGGGGNIRGTVNISDTLECRAGNWIFQPEADIISYGRHLIATSGTHRYLAPTDAPIEFDTVTIGPPPEGSLSVYFGTGQPVNIGVLDLNRGGVVDLEDYGLFQSCYSGSDQPPSASCARSVNADLDEDGDTDHDDYRLLFAAITQ